MPPKKMAKTTEPAKPPPKAKAKAEADLMEKDKRVAEAKERKKKAMEAELAVVSPADAEATEELEAVMTADVVIIASETASRSYIKLGPTKEKPTKKTRQSMLLEVGLSKSMAPSLNPPPLVTSGMRVIPVAK